MPDVETMQVNASLGQQAFAKAFDSPDRTNYVSSASARRPLMQVPYFGLAVARKRFADELTFEKLAEHSGETDLSSRTVINVLAGATEARDCSDEGFFNITKALVDKGKLPAFDRELAAIECYRRKRFASLSDDLAAGKCDLDRLRDFLVPVGCPTLNPLRQRTWDLMLSASYARYYGADLRL